MLNQEYLQSILDYCPATGVFTWKKRVAIRVNIGDVAGGSNGGDYLRIYINGRSYFSHHLAWLYVYGYMPNEIDHEDRNGLNNSIKNLRECTSAENQQNKGMRIDNTSGLIGASWDKNKKKWRSQIKVSNKKIFLGYFKTVEDAHIAYISAKMKYHLFSPKILT